MRIIARSEWGAKHARGFRAAPLPARALWEHHSATTAPPPDATFEQDVAAVRTLERIGQDRFGGGISYTFAVCPSGRVFEGHGIDRQGAHTGGQNRTSRAICLVGNYDTAKPTEAMVQAVAELVAHGHRSGWWPDQLTGGHRDAPGASTACPGRHAHALIAEINRRARTGTRPAPAPREDDMELTDLLPDRYKSADGKGLPPLNVGDQISHGTAHAAHARDWAKLAAQRTAEANVVLARVEAALDRLDDPAVGAAVSRAEFDDLARRVEALETRTTGGTP